jgi:hypothetical protein
MSLNIAAGLGLGGNESYPDLFQPFGGFPDGVKVDNGYVTMPDLPGIGFEGKADLYREMQKLDRHRRRHHAGAFHARPGTQLKPLGDLFIKLIKMLLAPIIFASIVVGVARMNNVHEAGRVGLKAVLYFEIASTFALAIGLVVVNLFQPGQRHEHRSRAPRRRSSAWQAMRKRPSTAGRRTRLHPEHGAQQRCRRIRGWRNAADYLLLAAARDRAGAAGQAGRTLRRHARHVPAGDVRRRAHRHVRGAAGRLRRHGIHGREIRHRHAGVVRTS